MKESNTEGKVENSTIKSLKLVKGEYKTFTIKNSKIGRLKYFNSPDFSITIEDSEVDYIDYSQIMQTNIKIFNSKVYVSEMEEFNGNLTLFDSSLNFKNLQSIEGNLDVSSTQEKEIRMPELTIVHGSLIDRGDYLKLNNLQYVGKYLNLINSKIKELPNLDKIGVAMFVDDCDYFYWKEYFHNRRKEHLQTKIYSKSFLVACQPPFDSL